MRALLHPVFWGSVVLFIVHQLLQREGIHHWLPDSYLDDLLCMPVVLTLALAFLRVFKKDPALRLSLAQVAFALLQVALTFELLLPRLADKYKADLWDVPVYVLGAALWWLTVNKRPAA